MFQISMSRALVYMALCLAVLVGCNTQPQPPVRALSKPPACACVEIQKWLELQRKVAAMSEERVAKILSNFSEPKGQERLFYFGLLNQQLDSMAGWTKARDSFRSLTEQTGLTKEQRNLSVILQRYNQTRINWYFQQHQLLERHETLKAKLRASQEENDLLEQKIQAITDLETDLSTRKEQ